MPTAPQADILIKLLESYVLSVLGESKEEDVKLAEDALARVSKRPSAAPQRKQRGSADPGTWTNEVRELFGLESAVEAQLRDLWGRAQAIALKQGHALTAREFAKLIVEENFADSIGMLSTELESPAAKRRERARKS